MYHGEGVAFDPEGLMNTFAAIVQVILGYLVGNYILQKGKTPGNAQWFICCRLCIGIYRLLLGYGFPNQQKNMDQQLYHLHNRPCINDFISNDLFNRI